MPTDLYYPGVQTVEKAFQPGAVPGGAVSTLGAFIGRSHQGPLESTLVSSWAEFSRLYGTNYTDLHNAVNDFYTNGGNTCAIVRIDGTGAAAASLKVYDDTVVAPSAGNARAVHGHRLQPWSVGQRAEARRVDARQDQQPLRRGAVQVRRPPSPAFDPQKRNTEYLLDQWIDVSLHPNDSRYLYSIANEPSIAGSVFVTFSGQSYNPVDPRRSRTRARSGATPSPAASTGRTAAATSPPTPTAPLSLSSTRSTSR